MCMYYFREILVENREFSFTPRARVIPSEFLRDVCREKTRMMVLPVISSVIFSAVLTVMDGHTDMRKK